MTKESILTNKEDDINIISYKDLPEEGKGKIPPHSIIQLENCPFCGSVAYLVNVRGESYAECSNVYCNAKTKRSWNIYEAMKAWNTRV